MCVSFLGKWNNYGLIWLHENIKILSKALIKYIVVMCKSGELGKFIIDIIFEVNDSDDW